ncbi:Protein wos2 [Golovinomyces cichoracearum]|uniref:Protein wos2 n=1 Tax=Golovinomyces cichoracearum TaxID=62708 RepID=A0A420HHF6_9PEZI|nr:Protein wos2 [Golovinomyces cichoracearum]
MTTIPEILWAQRSSSTESTKNSITLTISVPDVVSKDCKIEIEPKSIAFSGYSSSLKRQYSFELELYDEIIPENCTIVKNPKEILLRLVKKELRQEYWPRLTKEKKKFGFIKTDFDRWVDEDEQDQPLEEDSDMLKYLRVPAFSGGMGGMPGMGDMSSMMGGGGGDFGGIDFSKLGGNMGEEDGDDDDEDMPSLEGDNEKSDTATEVKDTTESTSKAKIEEVP